MQLVDPHIYIRRSPMNQ